VNSLREKIGIDVQNKKRGDSRSKERRRIQAKMMGEGVMRKRDRRG
jgi:hypothetical protein